MRSVSPHNTTCILYLTFLYKKKINIKDVVSYNRHRLSRRFVVRFLSLSHLGTRSQFNQTLSMCLLTESISQSYTICSSEVSYLVLCCCPYILNRLHKDDLMDFRFIIIHFCVRLLC